MYIFGIHIAALFELVIVPALVIIYLLWSRRKLMREVAEHKAQVAAEKNAQAEAESHEQSVTPDTTHREVQT